MRNYLMAMWKAAGSVLRQNLWTETRRPWVCLFLTWGLYMAFLFGRLFFINAEGAFAGHPYVWADWSLHLGMVNWFVDRPVEAWFSEHPLYAGGKFTYPFLTNWISAQLVSLGLPLGPAMTWTSILYAWAVLAGFFCIARRYLGSAWYAWAAVSLFFLSSGFGVVDWFADWVQSGFAWEHLSFTNKDYSARPEYGWLAGNVLSAVFTTQRAFLLGFAVGSLGFYGYLIGLDRARARQKNAVKILFGSGVLLGFLPIVHAHTLIFLAPLIGSVAVVFVWDGVPESAKHIAKNPPKWLLRLKTLLWFGVPFTVLALTLMWIFVKGGIENPSFSRWNPGWGSRGGFLGWLWMWFRIWGIVLPLGVLGWLALWQNRAQPRGLEKIAVFAGVTGIFILANLILFQPQSWDNSKIFFWCNLFFCILALEGLRWALQFVPRQTLRRGIAVVVFGVIGCTGMLEVYRMQRIDRQTYRMTSAEQIQLAQEIRKDSLPGSVFLTAPAHNHWLSLWAARPIVMGYTGWILNYGFDFAQREKQIDAIYRGEGSWQDLVKALRIHYVVFGEHESQRYHAVSLPKHLFCAYPVWKHRGTEWILDTTQRLTEKLSGCP